LDLAEKARTLLNLEPGEGRGARLMLAHSFAMGLATVFFETAASALFLARFEKDALPYVYIAAAVLNTLTGLVYSAALDRLQFGALMRGTLAFLLVCVLALRAGLAISSAGAIYFALLVFYRILSALTDLEYWALAGRLYDVRQAKRLYGMVGTGEVVARIAGSFSIPLLLKLMDVRNLVLVSALALLGCLWLLVRVLPLIPETSSTLSGVKAQAASGGLRSFARLLANGYLLTLFSVIVFGVLAKYFVDYAFLSALKGHATDPAAFASFFGLFSGITQVLSLLCRLFVSGPLIERHGIRFGLLVLPLFHVVCTGLILLDSALFGQMGVVFWLVVANQGLYKVLKHPIDNPSFKVLYQPLRRDQRLAAQIAVETMVTPITTGLAGAVMLFFTVVIPYTPVRFAGVMLFAFAGWVLVARRAGDAYSTALTSALKGRIVHDGAFDWSDERSVALLEETLKSERPDEVLFALDMIERTGHPRFVRDAVRLFSHADPAVRRGALLRVERARPKDAVPWLMKRVAEETDPAAREAAVRALLSLAGPEATPYLMAALESDAPRVRAAAATGLLRLGGAEGEDAALHELRAMVESSNVEARIAAASVPGGVHHVALDDLLARLLRDRQAEVRRAALVAAGRLADPALFPRMIAALGELRSAGTAASALATAGAPALAFLEAAFEERPALRLAIARVLGRIRDPRAREFLNARRAHPDEAVRTAVFEALRAHGFAASPEERQDVERELFREVEDAAATLGARRDLGGAPEWALLARALEREVERNRRRAFLLLSFLYDARAVLRARDNLAHAAKDRRAYAQELLEVTLPREVRERALPLLETLDADERLERLSEQHPQGSPQPPLERVREVLEIPAGGVTAWTRSAALYCVAKAQARPLRDLVALIAAQDGPVLVRETAAWAAGQLKVAGFETQEATGMITLERVIVLKSVDMFEGASEQVLADIAAILEETQVPAGKTIFNKGDLGDSLYVIVDGRVRVFDGATTLGVLGERDIFGELALLDPEPRSASIAALEDTQLFRLDREAFSELMAANIDIVRGVLHVLCERLRGRNERALNGGAISTTNAATNPDDTRGPSSAQGGAPL
jgi:HEAT repeat protein